MRDPMPANDDGGQLAIARAMLRLVIAAAALTALALTAALAWL